MPRTRRDLLAALGATGSLALAGCAGGGDGTGTATKTVTDRATATQTTAPATTTGTGTPTESTSATATATETETATATATASAGAQVEIEGFAYAPMRLEVGPGTTVEWVNRDGAPHDVTSDQFTDAADAWDFASETLSQGAATSHEFSEEGVYEYYCTIHGAEAMCGAVLVGDVSHEGTLPCED